MRARLQFYGHEAKYEYETYFIFNPFVFGSSPFLGPFSETYYSHLCAYTAQKCLPETRPCASFDPTSRISYIVSALWRIYKNNDVFNRTCSAGTEISSTSTNLWQIPSSPNGAS